MTSLYNKYRPAALGDVRGQPVAVAQLEAFLANRNVPHAVLFTGPSGVGKTTLARILASGLGCGDGDLHEVDSATFRGMDHVRDLRRDANYRPMGGAASVWILDECHKYLSASQATMLKLLEEPPPHAYYFLCTTNPEKLLKAVHTRCTKISLQDVPDAAVAEILDRVVRGEGFRVSDAVLRRIVAASAGSARDAVVRLEQVAGLAGEAEMLAAVGDPEYHGKSVAQLLFSGGPWREVVAALKAAEKATEAESLRHAVLGYAKAVLCAGGPKGARAAEVIRTFQFDTYAGGWPALYGYCWEVSSKKN